MHTLRLFAITGSIAVVSAASPSLAQTNLAGSGNLLGTQGGSLVSTTSTQPNWPHDPHQSSTMVAATGGGGGANASANGGDLAPNVVANKNVATPGSNSSLANRSVGVVAEVGTNKDNDLQSGLTGRAFVTQTNGSQQTTTYRSVTLLPNGVGR